MRQDARDELSGKHGQALRGAVLIESAHAVVVVDNRYALQLRDDKPGIIGPGLWGLFGGTLMLGERPDNGLRRELWEELRIRVETPRLFWRVDGRNEFDPTPKRWWFFDVDATATWSTHELHEGQAVELFMFESLPKGRMTPMTWEAIARRHGNFRFAGGDEATL